MNTKQAELLQRLEKFSPDSADAAFPFSSRLAKENQWSLAYTNRVIAEYKRFAFLSVEAGHPVSPSEDVDQVWHLHLTYSQSYWKDFCPEILQTPLHHSPTRGGVDESAKFDNWYRKTFESYRRFFGEPPRDIWPTPEEKAAQKNHFVRVDKETHWVIPKLRLPKVRIGLALVTLALLGLAGCGGDVNPFNWKGPDFLLLFFLTCAFSFTAAAILRWKWREPSDPGNEDFSSMDPYSAAFLNGGKILAVNTAISSLVDCKMVRVDADDQRLFSIAPIDTDAPPLEKAIHVAASSGEKIPQVREAAKPVVTAMMEQLQGHGLIVSDAQASKVRWNATLIALFPVLMGIVKIGVGLSRGKPVSFLVVSCIIATVVALIAFARRPHRSRRGDAVLKQLQERYRDYKDLKLTYPTLTPQQVALGIGLFGMTALAGTAMADLEKTLRPPSSADGGSGGCGSSCGGGGCGGGGCGGCGGGD